MNARRDLRAVDRALKIASRDLVDACGRGAGAAATIEEATGVHTRQQRMSDCGNRQAPDFLRIDEVGCLEDVAPTPLVTLALARRQGFELVPAPSRDVPETKWSDYAARLIKETGDVLQTLGEALASGDVDSSECERIAAEADDLVGLAVELRQAARRATGRC